MDVFEGAQEIVARTHHNDTAGFRDAGGADPGIGIGALYLYAVLINGQMLSGICDEKKSAIHASSINSAMFSVNE